MGHPAASGRFRRRSRRPFLLTALRVGLVTAIGCCAVLWLAAYVLTDVPEADRPLTEGAELFKAALAIGLSKWAAAAQGP